MIVFRPMGRDDLAMLGTWLDRPHVARWWSPHRSDTVAADFGPAVDGDEPTAHFVVLLDDRPIGMVQRYRLGDYPDWLAELAVVDAEASAVGIDYLIGEPDLVGRGLGPQMIARFVDDTWASAPDAVAIVADVDPENRPSWRALERCGFERIWTGDLLDEDTGERGPAHVYRLARPAPPGDDLGDEVRTR